MEQRIICEVLAAEGAFNLRDLGGYRAGNRTVRSRRFLRAGSLSRLTERGCEQIRSLGVSCIVDLRSSREVSMEPNPLAGAPDIAYHHVPMLDYIQSNISSGNYSTFPASMAEMYVGLLDGAQAEILRAFRVMADPARSTVLFHCTAGKDRTGVTAMLLLQLAGVSEDDIVADYALSERLIEPRRADGRDDRIPSYVFGSKPETMRAALGHLREAYVDAERYLGRIGLTGAETSALRAKLLD